jgi:hypothetical protein
MPLCTFPNSIQSYVVSFIAVAQHVPLLRLSGGNITEGGNECKENFTVLGNT